MWVTERRDLGREVVAHQVKLVPEACFGWVNGELGQWQGKDQPTVSSIDRGQPQDIAEEGPIRRGIHL